MSGKRLQFGKRGQAIHDRGGIPRNRDSMGQDSTGRDSTVGIPRVGIQPVGIPPVRFPQSANLGVGRIRNRANPNRLNPNSAESELRPKACWKRPPGVIHNEQICKIESPTDTAKC